MKAAGNLNLGTGSPGNGTLSISSAEADVAAYKKILQKALEVYRQENALPGVTSGEARSRRDAALGGEREILKWMEAKARLSEEMNILQAGKDSFKEQVLDRKQVDLDRSSSTVEQCRQSYTEALNQFSKATKAYEVLLSQANEAKSRYEQARFERDRAEAMYQYASTGYTLPGFTPEEIVADRSRRVEDMQRVLYRLQRPENPGAGGIHGSDGFGLPSCYAAGTILDGMHAILEESRGSPAEGNSLPTGANPAACLQYGISNSKGVRISLLPGIE